MAIINSTIIGGSGGSSSGGVEAGIYPIVYHVSLSERDPGMFSAGATAPTSAYNNSFGGIYVYDYENGKITQLSASELTDNNLYLDPTFTYNIATLTDNYIVVNNINAVPNTSTSKNEELVVWVNYNNKPHLLCSSTVRTTTYTTSKTPQINRTIYSYFSTPTGMIIKPGDKTTGTRINDTIVLIVIAPSGSTGWSFKSHVLINHSTPGVQFS